MNKKNKILFIYQKVAFYKWMATFSKKDLEILKENYDVTLFKYNIKNYISLPIKIKNSDLIFIWFANYHALLPTIFAKIMKKPTIIVTGGYEVAYEKDFKYGLMRQPVKKQIVKIILKNAKTILAVSEFNKKEGKKHLNLKNIEVVYNAVDTNLFTPKGEKENIVLTVAAAKNQHRIRLKGLDKFVQVAKLLPDIKFVLIGAYGEAKKILEETSPKNVSILGPLPQGEIIQYYQKAKIYCHLSYYESFSMTTAEAMSCECIPIVTNRSALPELVGDTGYLVKYGGLEQISDFIKKALKDKNKGKRSRNRIISNFSTIERKEHLKKIINNILDTTYS